MSASNFFCDHIRRNFSFEPTSCQETLFERISDFTIQRDECDILVVNGYAGTGKTSAIGAYVKTLKEFEIKFKLMAPTGRAAKVLAGYTGYPSLTIHKQIYRQKSSADVMSKFTLDFNKSNDTVYIVDEASLISIDSPGSLFGSGNLLMDLVQYVRNGSGNKLILVGDNAQLPPVMEEVSPALDKDCLSVFGNVEYLELSTVVRQAEESGILHNATIVRKLIESYDYSDIRLKLELDRFKDIVNINGGELIESLDDAFGRYGTDETVVLCRSNKRANRYNNGIRASVLSKEEQLCRGDKVMVVKNCYQFLEDVEELDFIANGDVAELVRIRNYEERYGLHFADATLSFPDYRDIEISAKIILDTLQSETAALTQEQQQALYEGVYADYDHLSTKKARNKAVREDKYYNALQIKYAAAITCHKSQGGQWSCVFIDNPFWQEKLTSDDLKWLYTALTRGVEKVYLVNFPKHLISAFCG